MQYFICVDEEQVRIVRPATGIEIQWYEELADTLSEYKQNINRFERVEENYRELLAAIDCQGKSMLQAEKEVKNSTANFLYAFNECIDHWRTYIQRKYGKTSAYFKRYTALTAAAYDSFDEYRITYGLRNFQHVDWVVQSISIDANNKITLYANRDLVLSDGGLNSTQKEAIRRQEKWINLLPIFSIAKNQLEKINIKLIFYTVTPEIEKSAVEALRFKEEIGAHTGSLLLGILRDENKKELILSPETFENLIQKKGKFTLDYNKEIPWGVCQLLRQFQGTDYKQCQ